MSKMAPKPKHPKQKFKPGKEMKHGKAVGHGTEVSGAAGRSPKSAAGLKSGKVYGKDNRQVSGHINPGGLKGAPGGGPPFGAKGKRGKKK